MFTTTRTRTRRTIAGGLAAVLLLATACSDDGDDASPTADRSTTPSTTTTTAAVAQPVTTVGEVEPSEMTFTFTGAPGEEGCRYESPSEVSTSIASTLNNVSDQAIFLTMARLADGATEQDFLDAHKRFGDTFPVFIPQGGSQAHLHGWMQGDWLQLHIVGAGGSQTVEKEALFKGDYVAFCWMESPEGVELWPGGSFRVVG
jgi:hypothetical protein